MACKIEKTTNIRLQSLIDTHGQEKGLRMFLSDTLESKGLNETSRDAKTRILKYVQANIGGFIRKESEDIARKEISKYNNLIGYKALSLNPTQGVSKSFTISVLKKEDKDAYTNCKDNWVEEVQSYDNLSTALSRFKPNEASRVALAYSLKTSNIQVDKPTFPWFDEWSKLLETVSRRSIIWIYDDVGNSGKTWATKYMMCKDNNCYIVKNFGRRADFATIIINAINSGWSGKYFIADLPRTMEDSDSIYGCLEDCVDGIVTSTKYSGKTIVFNSPIVTVFSNFLPQIAKMSADRWCIYTINNNKSLSTHATNIKESGV